MSCFSSKPLCSSTNKSNSSQYLLIHLLIIPENTLHIHDNKLIPQQFNGTNGSLVEPLGTGVIMGFSHKLGTRPESKHLTYN